MQSFIGACGAVALALTSCRELPAPASGGAVGGAPPVGEVASSGAGAGGSTSVAEAGTSGVGAGGAVSGGAKGEAGQMAAFGGDGGGDGADLHDLPNAANTGVSIDFSLIESDGLFITQDGTVVELLDATGAIVVRANDVAIRDCRLTSDATAIRFEQGTNLLVERVTLLGKSAKSLGASPTFASSATASAGLSSQNVVTTARGRSSNRRCHTTTCGTRRANR